LSRSSAKLKVFFEGVKKFQPGMKIDRRSGRLITSRSDLQENKVTTVVRNDGRLTVQNIEEEQNVYILSSSSFM